MRIEHYWLGAAATLLITAAVAFGVNPRDYPIGGIGGRAVHDIGTDFLEVKELWPGEPGKRGGLKPGDKIVGVNGRRFLASEYTKFKAPQPLKALGEAIDVAEGRSDGKLVLMVERAGKPESLTLKLRNRGSFSPTFPVNCPKSEAMIKGCCEYMCTQRQSAEGGFGGPASAMMTLALMAGGRSEYKKNLKKSVEWIVNQCEPGKLSNNNWKTGWFGIALCEYYYKTKDPKVRKAIEFIVSECVWRQFTTGGYGHGVSNEAARTHKVVDGDKAYHKAGFMPTTTLLFWFLASAKKCEIEVPNETWGKCLAGVRKSHKNGEIGYNLGDRGGGSPLRSGQAGLGMAISGADPGISDMVGETLYNIRAAWRDNHAVCTAGIIPASAAMHMISPERYHACMEEYRWWFTLAWDTDDRAVLIAGNKNRGGDKYLGWDKPMNAAVILMLAAPKKNLFMHSNYVHVEGVDLATLPPGLKVYYNLILNGRTRDVVMRLGGSVAGNRTRAEDAEPLQRMVAYVEDREIGPALDEVESLLKGGDPYSATVGLSRLAKQFPVIHNTELKKRFLALKKRLSSSESIRLAAIGAECETRVAAARTSPDALTVSALEAFARKNRNTPYADRARIWAALLDVSNGR